MRELEVYGRRILVERTANGWIASTPGDDGKRQSSPAMVIPSFVNSDEELLQYLADLWHESARPDRQTVRFIR
jgi:hypothetical protein